MPTTCMKLHIPAVYSPPPAPQKTSYASMRHAMQSWTINHTNTSLTTKIYPRRPHVGTLPSKRITSPIKCKLPVTSTCKGLADGTQQ